MRLTEVAQQHGTHDITTAYQDSSVSLDFGFEINIFLLKRFKLNLPS